MDVAKDAGIRDASAQDVGDQPVQPVPLTARADGLHEQVRPGELGERRRTVRRVGQGIGQTRRHDVDETDPDEEIQQFRGQRVDHLAEQVGRHRVVVPREPVDEPGRVLGTLHVECGKP
jgi:hypothetical protein